jgi:outer membrane protein assembly factor BamB
MTAALMTLFVVIGAFTPERWSRFRGPNGAGVVSADSLPTTFDATHNVAWRTALPPGVSSPVLSDAHVFVTAAEKNDLLTIAVDRQNGAIAWRARVTRGRELHVDRRNHPASPTPVTDGDNVYVFFQDFGMLSYDRTGRERWRHALGPFNNAYGMAASPILVDDLVVLVCDQSIGSFMIALDKRTGRERWKVERPEATSGHSTPVLFEPPGGAAELLVPGSFYLTAYEARTGRKLWWADGLAFEMKATPVHDGRTVYISGTAAAAFEDSYGRNIPPFEAVAESDRDRDGRFSREELPDQLARRWFALLDLDRDGFISQPEWARYREARKSSGGLWAFSLTESGERGAGRVVWHYEKAVPQLPSPLLYQDTLYMVSDAGVVTAIDPRSGTQRGQRRLDEAPGSYYASPVAGDGKLFFASESGRIVVIKAGAALETLAVNDLDEPTYATPALAQGAVFVRTQQALYCFRIRSERRPLSPASSPPGIRPAR